MLGPLGFRKKYILLCLLALSIVLLIIFYIQINYSKNNVILSQQLDIEIVGNALFQTANQEKNISSTEYNLNAINVEFLKTNASLLQTNASLLQQHQDENVEKEDTEDESLFHVKMLISRDSGKILHCGHTRSIDTTRKDNRCTALFGCLENLMDALNLRTMTATLLPNFYTTIGDNETTQVSNLKEYQENPHIGFVHLPKTGGTSVEALLKKYLAKRDYSIDPLTHCTNFFKVGHRKIRQYLTESERTRPMFMFSKRVFGIHYYIVDQSRPFVYLTWLREPISRLLSTFYYIRKTRNRSHFLYGPLLDARSLADYLNDKRSLMLPEFNNYYVRLLTYKRYPELDDRFEDCCGAYIPDKPLPEIREEHYLEAKRVLQHEIAFVGITEEFKLSQDMLCTMLGLPLVREIEVNTNPHREVISEDIRKRLVDLNYWEIRLYEDALKIFQTQKEKYKKMNNSN